MLSSAPSIQLSVVTTIYNAEAFVPILVNELTKNILKITDNYEIILVEDCGADNSWETIKKICLQDPKIKGIKLSRNFGQQIAMSAGIKFASGKFIIIMDGDLQNPPEEIPNLYKKIGEGYDIVYTSSKTRNNFTDEFTSHLFWLILTKWLKVRIVKNQLMMKIMTFNFAQQFNSYHEITRFVGSITHDIGMKETVMEIENKKRTYGKSNYNFTKRVNVMIDFVIHLSNAPLNFMIYFGGLIFIFTGFLSVYYLIKYLAYDISPGFTSIILSIFFFGSITTLMLGLIGKYLSNIYTEVRNRPLYIIKDQFNFSNHKLPNE